MIAKTRTPGDALEGNLVKQLRLRSQLTQEAFADRLGVRGGRSVVSAWETGVSACEGPVAELILALFGAPGTLPLSAVLTEMEKLWNRAKREPQPWRQVSVALLDTSSLVDSEKFMKAFPAAALSESQHVHRFPFTEVRGQKVYGLGPEGWIGNVPVEPSKAPSYLWHLKRTGAFAYRERLWEVDQDAGPVHGNILAVSLIEAVAPALAFYSKFAEHVGLTRPKVVAQLDADGIRGRGVVFQRGGFPQGYFVVDEPPHVAVNDHLAAQAEFELADDAEVILQSTLRLVSEFLMTLRPDDASVRSLYQQAKIRWDDEHCDDARRLGCLDDCFGKKPSRDANVDGKKA
jgi:transcriptional regulator with XRE-family HTH domain